MGRWWPSILVAAGISVCPSVAQAQAFLNLNLRTRKFRDFTRFALR